MVDRAAALLRSAGWVEYPCGGMAWHLVQAATVVPVSFTMPVAFQNGAIVVPELYLPVWQLVLLHCMMPLVRDTVGVWLLAVARPLKVRVAVE